jgi:hypothetical protein
MTKLNLLAAMGSAIMLALIAGTSAAAPLSQAADATIKAAGTLTIVEQAHGIHRSCQLGPVRRWGGRNGSLASPCRTGPCAGTLLTIGIIRLLHRLHAPAGTRERP